MPTAIPSVSPALANVSVSPVPDFGVSEKEANGGFCVKVTGEGEPDIRCETITSVGMSGGFVSATIVPSAIKFPAAVTAIPAVTPLASAKCKTRSSPPSMVAGELVSSGKENPGVLESISPGDCPRKETTVPAGT